MQRKALVWQVVGYQLRLHFRLLLLLLLQLLLPPVENVLTHAVKLISKHLLGGPVWDLIDGQSEKTPHRQNPCRQTHRDLGKMPS